MQYPMQRTHAGIFYTGHQRPSLMTPYCRFILYSCKQDTYWWLSWRSASGGELRPGIQHPGLSTPGQAWLPRGWPPHPPSLRYRVQHEHC